MVLVDDDPSHWVHSSPEAERDIADKEIALRTPRNDFGSFDGFLECVRREVQMSAMSQAYRHFFWALASKV